MGHDPALYDSMACIIGDELTRKDFYVVTVLFLGLLSSFSKNQLPAFNASITSGRSYAPLCSSTPLSVMESSAFVVLAAMVFSPMRRGTSVNTAQ